MLMMPLSDFFGVVPEGCEVRFIDAQHGNGIFATLPFAKGEVIYREKPLVSFQQAYNRQEAWTCAHCGIYLGNLDLQFAKHLGLTRLKIVSNIRLPRVENCISTGVEPVSCIGECGEMYCSEHALETNELFILAAQLIARMISLWLENGKQGKMIDLITQFLNKFTHKLWWEMPHEDSSPEELQKISRESITLLQQAFSIPFADSKTDLEEISSLFIFEFYAKLLALLEINEVAIGITAPLEKYRKELDKLNTQDRITAEKLLTPLMNKLKQMQLEECDDEGTDNSEMADSEAADDEEDEEDEEGEEGEEGEGEADDEIPIFSNYEGIGMFPFTAMMNHSCEPNCQVNFEDNNVIVLNVLAPIASGTQIMQSYIYENGPLRERQAELRSYGFVCDCPKCARQVAAQQTPQPKKKDKQKKK